MVDFTTPNLLGASEEFNKLVSQFDSIKESLKGKLEAEIDDVKSEVGSSLSVLDADMKSLIPELPSTPDISFISEVTNLIETGSASALANIASQFGGALSGGGFSLDSILAGGEIPNFVIGPNGLPALKPDDVGMPDTDPERLDEDDFIEEEAASSLLTPAAEISSVNAPLTLDASVTAEKFKENTKAIQVAVASESGEISDKVKEEYDKADAVAEADAIKAKVASSPQVAKIKDAVATNKSLPPKTPVIELVGDAAVEITKLKVIQDELSEFKNKYTFEHQKLMQLLKKYRKPFPHNLIAGGKRKVVFNENKTEELPFDSGAVSEKSSNIKGFITVYHNFNRMVMRDIKKLDRKIKKRIDFIKGGSVTRIVTKSEGETTTKTIRAPDNLSGIQAGFDGFLGGSVRGTGGNSAEGILVAVEEAFEIAETSFTVPV